MNYTPEMIARLLDLDCSGFPRNFITPAIVAEVMNAQPGRFGYLVCGWPSTAEQSRIHALATRRKYGVPCPEPREAGSPDDQLHRDCVSQGFRGVIDAWDGMTAEGRIMETGVAFGRFFRLDDPRPILAVAG